MAQDFDKICRTCTVELENAIQLSHMLTIDAQEVKLGDILSTLTSFEITENDNLPQQICAQCEMRLINAFSFQQQCYKSNKIFRTVIESQQNDESDFLSTYFDDNIEQTPSEDTLSAEENLDQFYRDLDQNMEDQQNEDLQMSLMNISTEGEENGDIMLSSHTRVEDDSYCKEGFTSASDELTTHRQRHDCHLCGKTYSRLESYSVHLESHNVVETKCRKCEKIFSGPLSLQVHMRSHLETYECDVCHKIFRRYDYLATHQKIHTGERPHICTTCGASFITKSKLNDHTKRHSNSLKTPYVCKICHKEFARPSHLTAHSRTHTGERPFVCTICDKTFITQSQLNVHNRLHSDDNPFVCKICSRRFTKRNDVIRHEKSHYI